jgi:hypothetical protein
LDGEQASSFETRAGGVAGFRPFFYLWQFRFNCVVLAGMQKGQALLSVC